jgi:hypothetical protein
MFTRKVVGVFDELGGVGIVEFEKWGLSFSVNVLVEGSKQ